MALRRFAAESVCSDEEQRFCAPRMHFASRLQFNKLFVKQCSKVRTLTNTGKNFRGKNFHPRKTFALSFHRFELPPQFLVLTEHHTGGRVEEVINVEESLCGIGLHSAADDDCARAGTGGPDRCWSA